MAHIRTYEDLEAFGLSDAERDLVAHAQRGELLVLGDGTRPEADAGADRIIRAPVLRYLLLGGCAACRTDDIGVWLKGALIEGPLNLDYTILCGPMQLEACRFLERLDMVQTKLPLLSLTGGHLQGLRGLGLRCEGSVFLNQIDATAKIDLNIGEIGGQLALEGAILEPDTGPAFSGQGLCAGGGVFLQDVKATGEIGLNSSEIGGQLVLDDATLEPQTGSAFWGQGMCVTADARFQNVTARGEIHLGRAKIGGQLDFERAELAPKTGRALQLQDVRVENSLFWRGLKAPEASCDFSNAYFSDLVDDPACWPEAENLSFDGMTYDRLSGYPVIIDAAKRLQWLERGSYWNGEFRPQPYTQLAKVLREMGHDLEARKILAERERRLKIEARKALRQDSDPPSRNYVTALIYDVMAGLHWLVADKLLQGLIGYGHHPFRSLIALVFLIVLAIVPAHLAYEAGDFAPNSDVIQTSEGWQAALSADNPAKVWASADGAGRDWETFNRYAYGVDVVIPIINFGQTEAWAPSTSRGDWGWHLWWLKWVLSTAGWIVTALGAAAITGLIRGD
ncbi:hypothetical protein ACS3SW_06860 [Roseobacteraceae bacterium S113]